MDQNIIKESVHIHYKAVFDAFNEALNCLRLYKGMPAPLPWDKDQPLKLSDGKSKLFYLIAPSPNMDQEIDEITEKALSKMKIWADIRCNI